jgi:glycosyltransferase involved in cell wall biosynthesis
MDTNTPGLLFIVNSLGPGGAEKHAVTLLNRLDTGRFRLHLAYLKRAEQLLPQLDAARLDEVLCCDVGHGIERRTVHRLAALIRARNIHALVCINTYSMLYGYLARRALPGARPGLATVFHTTVPQTYKEKAQMLLYRQLFKGTDLLLYVSENQRSYWCKRGLRAARESVIHNGIDAEQFAHLQTPEEKERTRRSLGFSLQDYVIGLCSVLRPEKAHGDLLRALARVRAQGTSAKALFIGDGPERASIEAQVRELGLGEHVVITGFQPDVRPFVGCCDVMTLVSHTETFSLAALECMALGKPLVMSDVGGASEQVLDGETGLLFKPGDIDSLARQLATLTAPELSTQMGSAGQRRVRQLFTIDAMTAGFTDEMDRLLGSASAASRSQENPAHSRLRKAHLT